MEMKVNIKRKGQLLIGSSFMALGLLAGCGNGGGYGSEEEQVAPENEQVATEENEQAETEENEQAETEENEQATTEENEQAATEEGEADHIINVSAFEMGYTPPTITLTKGEEYTLVMKNDGELFHDLTSQDIDVEITYMGEMPDHPEEVSFMDQLLGVNKAHAEGDHAEGDEDGHDEEKNALHMNSKPGQTVEIKFIPKETGEFKFYCSIPGHKEAGIHGMFEVID